MPIKQVLPPNPASGIGNLPQHLLRTMPWAVLALDHQACLLMANPQAELLLGRSAVQLLGQPIAQALGSDFPVALRDALTQAATASQSVSGEFYLPHTQRWIEMSSAPGLTEVLVYWQDVTRMVIKRQQYQALADNSPDAISRWDADLSLLYGNPALATKAGQPVAALLGKTFPEMGAPDTITTPYESKVRQVFETGQPVDHYNPFPTPQGERYYHSRLVPEVHDGRVYTVLGIARDLTELQATEAELRTTNSLLSSVLDAPNVGLSAYQAVRDEAGRIQDFEYRLVSRGDGTGGASALVGRRLLDVYPTRQSCIARMRQVVETGITDTYEMLAPDGLWYLNSNARLGDGIVNVWTDITTRKLAEQAQRESQLMLQAIFDATLNSLEVVRSVRDEAGRVVDFEWLLANAAAKHLVKRHDLVGKRLLAEEPNMQTSGVFDRLRAVVEQQQATDFEQYYPYDGTAEWYHVSAAPLGDGLVVTWQNVTAGKRATTDLLALQRAQQQQLANAVLDAQETERGRIAEDLHNGLGQMLYAVQLRLASLVPTDAATFDEGKRLATELLQAAISMTHTLSHQLTPTVLADFGLVVAMRGLCRDLSTPKLHLQCLVDDVAPVPLSLALPLYRMAQELATNVARHADATEGFLRLREHNGWLELDADDNGRGFDPARPRPPGLGLNNLRDRVQLLNGELTMHSSVEDGTHIRIRVPRAGAASA